MQYSQKFFKKEMMLKKVMKNISHSILCGMQIIRFAFLRLFREKYTYRASALAFTTLLTLVPLVSVIVALIARFPIFTKLTDLARGYIFSNFLPTSSNTIQLYFERFVDQASKLPTFGLVFLFFTVMALIITVEHTLNEIWQVPKRKQKISAFALYWIILLVAPLFIGLSVLISSYLFSLSWIQGESYQLHLTIPLLKILPLLVNTVIFTTLYMAVPNISVKLSDALVGAFLASILFEVAKKGFALYIQLFPNYEVIYGTLATIPIFLIWIYISWLIVLFGALVSHSIKTYTPKRKDAKTTDLK